MSSLRDIRFWSALFALASFMVPALAQSPTTTRIVSWPNPSAAGRPILLSGEVDGASGAPTGSVSFAADAAPLGTVRLRSIGAGQATLAGGDEHTCALESSGGVVCWGRNKYGQLGDATTTTRLRPTQVSGLTDRTVAVATGALHSCALSSAGAVKCWRANYYAQLGDGTLTDRSTPVDVQGLSSGVVALSAGFGHTCALTRSGEVKCWGNNFRGAIGDGSGARFISSPVTVVGLARPATAIAAGGSHSCALLSGGGVQCWGANDSGQLGDVTSVDRMTAVDVYGLSSGVISISAGSLHTCALVAGGAAQCWGNNAFGPIGDGTVSSRRKPTAVFGLSSGVAAITAGREHTCALMNSGAVSCWGHNDLGQLGDNSAPDIRVFRAKPTPVLGLSTGIVAITSGRSHNCALSLAGALSCWGDNSNGQLADGNAAIHPIPSPVAEISSGALGVSLGANLYYGAHGCAVTSSNYAKCWGSNRLGKLGDGTTTDRFAPTSVVGMDGDVLAVAAGYDHTCALSKTGGVKCWGDNSVGQLGDGTTTDRLTPTAVPGLESGVAAISAGVAHNCALMQSGNVKCWGRNAYGELGDGTTIQRLTPVAVQGLAGVSALRSGLYYNCALTNAGGIKCWGDNTFGNLGDGTQTARTAPVDVQGLSSGVVAVSVSSGGHSCAVTNIGRVLCWGSNGYGQLGNGTTIPHYSPVPVLGLTNLVIDVVGGGDHTCAIARNGTVRCWGRNSEGQLGDGTMRDQLAPSAVAGLSGRIVSMAAAGNTSCARNSTGGLWCWGYNANGEVGYGAPLIRNKPNAAQSFNSVVRARGRMWTAVLGAGAHSLTATYGGSASHAPSSGAASHTVK